MQDNNGSCMVLLPTFSLFLCHCYTDFNSSLVRVGLACGKVYNRERF